MKTEIKKVTVLSGINKNGEKEKFDKIDIAKGEIVAIVGATGSGKSQLLYDIEKLAQGDSKSGRVILVNGERANRNMRFDPERKLIASLAQSMNFLMDTSVKDFLSLHLKARGKNFDPDLIEEVIREANEITGEPILPETNLLDLSGGQSRALMISDVANISASPIILIDEIENAGINKERAMQILVEEGKVILIVTHDPVLAFNADKRVVVKNGGVVNILKTTSKERDIAHFFDWLGNYSLEVREKIRNGEKVEEVKLFCEPIR